MSTTTPQLPSSISVGYDTLANGFGDVLYIRRRGITVECPFCGKWKTTIYGEDARCCPISVNVELCSDRWASVRTAHLLSTPAPRFFLPREWNNYRPWISKEELALRFQEYIKEKENV